MELQFTRHKQNVIYVSQRQRDEMWRVPRRHEGPLHRPVPEIEIYKQRMPSFGGPIRVAACHQESHTLGTRGALVVLG